MLIDPLESRRLLSTVVSAEIPSVTAKLSKTGTLFITGSSVRDTITVKSVAKPGAKADRVYTDGELTVHAPPMLTTVRVLSKQADGVVSVFETTFNQKDVKRIDISSGAGDDLVDANTGIKGRTVIYGGKGNDRLQTTGKNNALFGGSGDDVLRSEPSLFGLAVNSADLTDVVARNIRFSLNLLDGGDGNDTFYSRGGDDSILGGGGNDRFEPLLPGIVSSVATTLPTLTGAPGTFGPSRIALDDLETTATEPDGADVQVAF